jgi:hypothetical protein
MRVRIARGTFGRRCRCSGDTSHLAIVQHCPMICMTGLGPADQRAPAGFPVLLELQTCPAPSTGEVG